MALKIETYKKLKHRIITNELHSGQQLYEKELMQEYGIGRTPLREIFHELQRDGLIEILPKLGTRVVSMDLKILRETVQLRRELEGLAAELATQNISSKQLMELRQFLDTVKYLDDNAPNVLEKMAEIDLQIHKMIYRIAENQQLIQIMTVLLDKMTMYWFQVGFSAGEFKEQFEELELLYSAMVKGDAIKANKIMKDHISHFAKLITDNIF